MVYFSIPMKSYEGGFLFSKESSEVLFCISLEYRFKSPGALSLSPPLDFQAKMAKPIHVIHTSWGPYIRTEIPLVVMFRALGIVADRDILERIVRLLLDCLLSPFASQSVGVVRSKKQLWI